MAWAAGPPEMLLCLWASSGTVRPMPTTVVCYWPILRRADLLKPLSHWQTASATSLAFFALNDWQPRQGTGAERRPLTRVQYPRRGASKGTLGPSASFTAETGSLLG
jgi:hypothetical protein